MAAYSHFHRATIKVQYRLGDILLTATGMLVADSGRSIFLEERLEQRGKLSYFRWEIPYRHIHRVEIVSREIQPDPNEPAPQRAAAAAASSAGDASSPHGPISLPQSRQSA